MVPYLPHDLSHAVVAEGGKTIYLSGQLDWGENGNVVGAVNLKLFESVMPALANLMGVQALYALDIRCEAEATVVVEEKIPGLAGSVKDGLPGILRNSSDRFVDGAKL